MGSFIRIAFISLSLGVAFVASFIEVSLLKEERQRLYGLELRASAFNYPPCLFAIKAPLGNHSLVPSFSGVCHDIATWISTHFRMKLIYVPTNTSDIVKHGLIPALIKQIINGEVDIIPYAFAPSVTLLQQLDFTITLRVEDYNLLQQWPKEESRLIAYIRPFSYEVWLLFLGSTGFVVIAMAILTHHHQQLGANWKSTNFMKALNHHTMYVMTVITGQGNCISPKAKLSLRLIAGLWCLTMVVLVNAYSSTLMSYLTVPKLTPIVNTLAELAVSRDSQITIDFESDMSRMFMDASSGPYRILGNSLRNNPKLLVRSGSLEGLNNVLLRGNVYFANRPTVKYLMSMDMKSHTKCRLTSSDPIPYIRTYSMGLPKGSQHNSIINHDLQYLQESGLLDHWLKQYTPNVDKCMVGKSKPHERVVPFTLLDLSSAFLLLGIGIGLCLFAFLLELIVSLQASPREKITA
ncbi:ionotropic receptor 93a-like [Daphnia carinata]|uniref:ionotropic receptor 93a-like n=1 Tax=Daphnia carinata TaxID=120202 RepID=UPI00257E66D0|nr:ionotropic receptor 93a-like [Daphnia carinata]